ncbi:MAG TPA: sigma-54 dependent transcriptional regulator [Terriglobia bacterium]|nr:sigma-54 dependent transcriptional regulator [Terriglobia bacterium]
MEKEIIRVCFWTPEPDFGEVVSRALGGGFDIRFEDCGKDGVPAWEEGYDCVLLDLRDLPLGPEVVAGEEHFEKFRRTDFSPPIVVMLGDDDPAVVRRLVEAGAYDVLISPPDVVELRFVLRRAHRLHQVEMELRRLRAVQSSAGRLEGMIGFGENMQEVFAMARKVAPCDVNVLITGETGTGKSVLGRALHRLSRRSAGPFVAFSCANLPEHLVEDELFGHEKGAFTGALTLRRGRFEAAHGGTLFLDEIGDLPLGLQAKLLRVLHDRTFERLGSNTPLTVDVRLLCATHRNLEEMVKHGAFREDLYYRLNVIQLHLPPLRERNGGIALLAHHLLQQISQEFDKKVTSFSRLAIEAMDEYAWPGNVRELENVIRRAVVLAEGHTLEAWHLPVKLRNGFEQIQAPRSYEEELRDFKRRLVARTLQKCNGNKAETARVLGVARGYLHRLIHDLKIPSEEAFPESSPDQPVAPGIVM